MARYTVLRQAKKCLVWIFDLYVGPFSRGDVFRGVALVAGDPGVFAFQNISGGFVVEALWVPLDQWKILAIVFRMTSGAFLA